MTKRKRHQKTRTRAQADPASPVTKAILQAIEAQEHMARAEALSKRWQTLRREQVRAAFAAGAGTRELSAALGISRAKIYRLIGSARAIQA